MSARVIIDTPGPIYSGCQIQGKLICTFTYVQKVRNIKVRISGKEHTEWWRNERSYDAINKRQQIRKIKYYADNILFNIENLVFGQRNGELNIGPGTFTYPFSFQLPTNLPGSFQNQHGSIRYSIKGTVDVPWVLDLEDEACFAIATPIDLNNYPSGYFQPASVSDERIMCCSCCTSGLITVTASVQKIAFVVGESIKLHIVVMNLSRSNVYELHARLAQYIKSQVHYPKFETKTESFSLVDNSWSGVGAHGERTYDIVLEIPNGVVVPNFERSTLFKIKHKLEICAKIRGCHMNINLSLAVNLGHIHNTSRSNPTVDGWGVIGGPSAPPMDELPNYTAVAGNSALVSRSQEESTFFEQPPPSYEEISGMN